MPESSPAPLPPTGLPPVAHLRTKATALLLLTAALILGSALYLMYARGMFEATQPLVLLADDSEGVSVGMDVTFSGTLLSGSMREITIEFIAMRPIRVAYQIVYQRGGKWEFDKAQLIYDEAERFTAFGDRAGAVSAAG